MSDCFQHPLSFDGRSRVHDARTVIVTGGCGFIGSYLIDDLLHRGHRVLLLDSMHSGNPEVLANVPHRDRLQIVECDIVERGVWEDTFQGVDWVVHMAALTKIVESIEQPRQYFKTNVEGTLNVLEASRIHGVKRFVYGNSAACYGIADCYPTPEDAPKRPQYPYALMKLLGEELVLHWAEVYKLPTVSLRFFNIYGPGYGLLALFLSQTRAGRPMTVTGDGTQTRDFTYISDVVSGIEAALESDVVGEAYNIGSGSTVSLNQVAALLEAQVKYVPRRDGEMNITYGDIQKARMHLNWEPKVSIEEGIQLLSQHPEARTLPAHRAGQNKRGSQWTT